MLTGAASYLWHRGKNLRDLPYMGKVRREIARGGVPADIEGQVSFVMDRFGGSVRPIQDRHEITELVRRVADRAPRTVLEIGTARGGTLFLLCRAAHDEALVISLDLPYGRNGGGFPRWKEKTYQTFAKPGQKLVLQRGNSPRSRLVRGGRDAAGRAEARFHHDRRRSFVRGRSPGLRDVLASPRSRRHDRAA